MLISHRRTLTTAANSTCSSAHDVSDCAGPFPRIFRPLLQASRRHTCMSLARLGIPKPLIPLSGTSSGALPVPSQINLTFDAENLFRNVRRPCKCSVNGKWRFRSGVVSLSVMCEFLRIDAPLLCSNFTCCYRYVIWPAMYDWFVRLMRRQDSNIYSCASPSAVSPDWTSKPAKQGRIHCDAKNSDAFISTI